MTMPPLPPTCSHCGFPLIGSSSSFRHYGTHVAHQENECLRLLIAERNALKAECMQEDADHVQTLEDAAAVVAECRALEAERDALRTGLADAIESVKSWGAYASPYFRDKWDLDADIKRLEAVLTGEKT